MTVMETTDDNQNMKWSTREELLLSCAVHRYGNDSWDSVAIELQKRSSTFEPHRNFTAEICQQKFHDLKQQFNDRIIVDELKKLRVAELKRDVERYDLSIVSLQLKVKRLKEESSSNQNNSIAVEDDVDDKSSPANVAGKDVSDHISYHSRRSGNESNSTDPKLEDRSVELIETEPETVCEFEKPTEASCNGSSDTVAKESEEFEAVRVSDSSGGEGGRREISYVQSEVELPPQTDDQSPAIKSETVDYRSLVELLEILRSHKLGSIFQIQLESQEATRYKSMIRQHVDIETIQTRLEKGCYSNHNSKFFRDLLLLSNNALVFYGNKSSESMVAIEFRRLISNKWASTSSHPKLNSTLQEQVPSPPLDQPIEPDPVIVSETVATPLIVCRNRSSVTVANTSITSSEKNIEKLVMNEKQEEKLPVYTDKILRERRNTPKYSKSSISNTNTVKNEKSEAKPNNNSSVTAKKRGASNSSNRSHEHARETLRRGNSKADIAVTRDLASLRRGNNGKQVGGQAMKKAATLPPPVLGKRSREGCGNEVVASSSTRHGKTRLRR